MYGAPKDPTPPPCSIYRLHKILHRRKSIVVNLYYIGISSDVTTAVINVAASRICLEKRHFANTITVIAIGIFALLRVSDTI